MSVPAEPTPPPKTIAILSLMLAVFLPALFAPNTQFFMGLTLILISAGAWEWSRLNGWSATGALLGALLCFGVCVWALDLGWTRHVTGALWTFSGGPWVLLCPPQAEVPALLHIAVRRIGRKLGQWAMYFEVSGYDDPCELCGQPVFPGPDAVVESGASGGASPDSPPNR